MLEIESTEDKKDFINFGSVPHRQMQAEQRPWCPGVAVTQSAVEPLLC